MPSVRKGSGLKNCISLYFIHFYKTTDPVRHNFLRLDPFLLRGGQISEKVLNLGPFGSSLAFWHGCKNERHDPDGRPGFTRASARSPHQRSIFVRSVREISRLITPLAYPNRALGHTPLKFPGVFPNQKTVNPVHAL